MDGTDALQLSAGEVEGRRQVRDFFAFLRAEMPGFENAYLLEIAPQVGIRETRRVRGRAVLRGEDVLGCADFDDTHRRQRLAAGAACGRRRQVELAAERLARLQPAALAHAAAAARAQPAGGRPLRVDGLGGAVGGACQRRLLRHGRGRRAGRGTGAARRLRAWPTSTWPRCRPRCNNKAPTSGATSNEHARRLWIAGAGARPDRPPGRDIVALLAERGRYVLAAARFKRSADEVRAPQRVEQVVAKVRATGGRARRAARGGGAHLPRADRGLHRRRTPALATAMIAVERVEHAASEADEQAAIEAIDRDGGVWLGCDVVVPQLYRREAKAALDPLLSVISTAAGCTSCRTATSAARWPRGWRAGGFRGAARPARDRLRRRAGRAAPGDPRCAGCSRSSTSAPRSSASTARWPSTTTACRRATRSPTTAAAAWC